MPLFKSAGSTKSERYLAQLCESTFLSLWSYPNIWRNQGNEGREGKMDGKELCDLLIVCGNDVVIFSDKSCAFPDCEDIDTAWCRWYRRSIKKSAEQAFGAESWIRKCPERLFLDRKCTVPFPLPLPPIEQIRFHRVIVALNVHDRCRQQIGGRGSLLLYPQLAGDAHMMREHPDYALFTIGQVLPEKGYVHVFDDVTLDIVLKQLDTVTDFVSYLRKKEAFIASGKLYFAAGEENLLGFYLANVGPAARHDFIFPEDAAEVIVTADRWDALNADPGFQASKSANKDSYVWDGIIDSIGNDALAGTLLPEGDQSIQGNELALREMAHAGRFERRMLSHMFLGLLASVPKDRAAMRTTLSPDHPDVAYVFILMPLKDGHSDKYRLDRRAYAYAYCSVVAWRHKEYKHVIGIATESGTDNGGRSFDLLYISITEWTREMDERHARLATETGFYNPEKIVTRPVHDDEYPIQGG